MGAGCPPRGRRRRPAGRRSTRGPAACTWPRSRRGSAGTIGPSSTPGPGRPGTERRYLLVPTTCFNCESACGLLAYVDRDSGQVRKFEGNPEHPGSRGRNCAKGPATLNQVTDPDRILYPLRRSGPRGGGGWERISWDEALDALAARIRAAIIEERQNEIMIPHRPAGRGRLHRAGAGQLGGGRAQLAHQRVLVRRPRRLRVLDGRRPAQTRPREREGHLADLRTPRIGPLLQPPRAANRRGSDGAKIAVSIPASRTPPRAPTTGWRRPGTEAAINLAVAQHSIPPAGNTTASSSADGGTG